MITNNINNNYYYEIYSSPQLRCLGCTPKQSGCQFLASTGESGQCHMFPMDPSTFYSEVFGV